MTRFIALTLMISPLTACVGQKPLQDNVGGGGAGTGGGADSGGQPDPATCGAVCSTPAGTVASFSRVEDVYAAIQGSWGMCTSWSAQGAPSDVIGVEFAPGSAAPTANGGTVGANAYYLVSGPSGPERGAGFAYQLTYDVSPEGGSSFQLNIHPTPNSGFGGAPRYSPCPREFQFNFYEQMFLLVPIGDGSASGI